MTDGDSAHSAPYRASAIAEQFSVSASCIAFGMWTAMAYCLSVLIAGQVCAERNGTSLLLCRYLDAMGIRAKVEKGKGDGQPFCFSNDGTRCSRGRFHPKGTPVIRTTRQEIDIWVSAPTLDTIRLERPLSDDALVIVARDEKKDLGGLTL